MRGVNYITQLRMLERIVGKWRPEVMVAESNAMGKPLLEMLRETTWGDVFSAFSTTGLSKGPMIDNLALAFARKTCRCLNVAKIKDQFLSFSYNTLASGHVRYQAEKGKHDDAVMAAALGYRSCYPLDKPQLTTLWGAGSLLTSNEPIESPLGATTQTDWVGAMFKAAGHGDEWQRQSGLTRRWR